MDQFDTTPPRPVLNEREAARLLGVSRPTLQRYRRAGKPLAAFVRVGARGIRYRVEDVEAALMRRRVADVVEDEVAAAADAMRADSEGAVVEG